MKRATGDEENNEKKKKMGNSKSKKGRGKKERRVKKRKNPTKKKSEKNKKKGNKKSVGNRNKNKKKKRKSKKLRKNKRKNRGKKRTKSKIDRKRKKLRGRKKKRKNNQRLRQSSSAACSNLTCLTALVSVLKFEKDTVRNFLAQEKRTNSKLSLMQNKQNRSDKYMGTAKFLEKRLGETSAHKSDGPLCKGSYNTSEGIKVMDDCISLNNFTRS